MTQRDQRFNKATKAPIGHDLRDWLRQSLGSPPRALRIHAIDIYTPDPRDSGFNHGETNARKLEAGGGEPLLAGAIRVHRYNVGFPEGDMLAQTDAWAAKIAAVLDRLILLAEEDADAVDAVNISLQDFDETPHTVLVRMKSLQLLAMGIPVAVAAGNQGPNMANTLASEEVFVVQATENGKLRPESGPGNVRAEGGSTSYAVTAVTPLLARYKTQGYSIEAMRERLHNDMLHHGGALPGSPGGPIFGEMPVELIPLVVRSQPEGAFPNPPAVSVVSPAMAADLAAEYLNS